MKHALLVLGLILLTVSVHAQQPNVWLVPGWNMISINVVPEQNMFEGDNIGPDVPLMFEQVVDPEGNLLVTIVVDGRGRFYAPQFNFNNIGCWNLQQGLWVAVEEEVEAFWMGQRIDAQAEIEIIRGWNLISYFPEYRINADNDNFSVLSEIIDDVVIAVDGRGHFMLPEFEFSNMDPWEQGHSYKIKFNPDGDDINFSYPEEIDEEIVQFEPGDHWEIPIVSRDVMSVLVNDIAGPNGFDPAEGDQIAAFWFNGDNMVLTGFGDVHDGVCGIAVWGEDRNMDDSPFIVRDEEFVLVYWDEDQEAEYDMQVEDVIVGDGQRFSANDLTVIEVFVEAGEIDFELEVPLEQGWNMISINVVPPEELWENKQGPDVELMTEQLRIDDENHHLILMKDSEGRFYSPENDFNNIPFWNLEEGYQFKMDDEILAIWSGGMISPDADINLASGWNIIAYYPQFELDASSPDYYVLSNIIDNVLIAKDGDGHFLLPEFEFSDMDPWRPSLGYMVKVDEDIVLNYPSEVGIEDNIPIRSNDLEFKLTRTGNNMSLLVLGLQLEEGVILRAMDSNGILVGLGIANNDGKFGLAIWGDDPSTPEKDGLSDGETFTLQINDEVIQPTMFHTGSSLSFATDGFIVIDAEQQVIIPSEYYLSEAYPNPFNN